MDNNYLYLAGMQARVDELDRERREAFQARAEKERQASLREKEKVQELWAKAILKDREECEALVSNAIAREKVRQEIELEAEYEERLGIKSSKTKSLDNAYKSMLKGMK